MDHEDQHRPTRLVPIGRLAAAALAAAGLSASAIAIGTAGAATNAVKKVAVSTASKAKLGQILVSGKTLYTLKPSTNACTAQCLRVWPALVLPKGVTKATAGPGVSAAKLGTTTLPGGGRQVTYSGHALYKFSGDSSAGQVNGNVTDEWGTWSSVVTKKLANSKSSSSSGSSSGGSTSGTGGTAF